MHFAYGRNAVKITDFYIFNAYALCYLFMKVKGYSLCINARKSSQRTNN